MALADINTLIKAMTQSQNIIPFYKAGVTTYAAGSLHSLWQASGEPSAGATPSPTASIPTPSVTGAMPLINAVAGKLYIARASFTAATPGYYVLYDRISHSGGLVGNSTASQSCAAPTGAPERTGNINSPQGTGCRIYVEWYATTGTGTPTVTVTYTNENGLAGQTATAVWPASPVAGQMLRVPLATGDKGVRSIQSAQLSAATSAAGSWGITIVNPLLDIAISATNGAVIQDAIAGGLPTIANNAALCWLFMATATTHGAIAGQLTLIDV